MEWRQSYDPKSLGEDRWVTIFNLATGDILATCLLGLKSDKIDVVSCGDTIIDFWVFEMLKKYTIAGQPNLWGIEIKVVTETLRRYRYCLV